MKNSTLLMLALILWLATVVHGWSEQENGLLVYEEPPGTYVEVLRYTSITPGTAYAILTSPSGGTRHCWNGGLLAQVDYPSGGVDPYDANQHIQQIQSLLTTYPQYKVQLQGALARWQNALSAAKQIKPAPEASTAQAPNLPTMTVKNVTYRIVTLAGVDGNTVTITDSDGIARIQFTDLTDDQVNALNKTSASVHIDPDSISKLQAASKNVNEAPNWQKKAIAEYPELADANSDINHKFVAKVNDLRSSNPAYFNNPQWPYLLAEEVEKAQETEPGYIPSLLRKALTAAEGGNKLVMDQLLIQAAKASPNEPAIDAIRKAGNDLVSAQTALIQLNQATGPANAEATRLRQNAKNIDQPNPLSPRDTSYRQRVRQMRTQADQIEKQMKDSLRAANDQLRTAQEELNGIDIPEPSASPASVATAQDTSGAARATSGGPSIAQNASVSQEPSSSPRDVVTAQDTSVAAPVTPGRPLVLRSAAQNASVPQEPSASPAAMDTAHDQSITEENSSVLANSTTDLNDRAEDNSDYLIPESIVTPLEEADQQRSDRVGAGTEVFVCRNSAFLREKDSSDDGDDMIDLYYWDLDTVVFVVDRDTDQEKIWPIGVKYIDQIKSILANGNSDKWYEFGRDSNSFCRSYRIRSGKDFVEIQRGDNSNYDPDSLYFNARYATKMLSMMPNLKQLLVQALQDKQFRMEIDKLKEARAR